MNPNFEAAVAAVLKHERGFSDNAMDRGGPTNMGITLSDLSAYLGRTATIDELRQLTPDTARKIYQGFWDRAAMDRIVDQRFAIVLFDQVVLCGSHAAIGRLQTVLGNVAVTGLISTQMVLALAGANVSTTISKFLRLTAQAQIELVKKRPSQLIFLGGWIDRLWDLQQITDK